MNVETKRCGTRPLSCVLFSAMISAWIVFAAQAAHAASIPVSPDGQTLRTAEGFKVSNAPYGAFGGGKCESTRVPVVFVHGNGDLAGNWNTPASNGGRSVLAEFKKAGYTDCDLFGISYLSDDEREAPQMNFHRPEKGALIANFIRDVMAYTGRNKVDVVSHSLGVTMSLYAIQEGGLWNNVRRFVGIAGAMRGLYSCVWAGFANVFTPTCAAQSMVNDLEFGFWPHGVGGVHNPRIGSGAQSYAVLPQGKPTQFYTISADIQDQVVCKGTIGRNKCVKSPQFEPAQNIRSQVRVGKGRHAPIGAEVMTSNDILNEGGDFPSEDGVGHLRAKTDTGKIQVKMLTSDCVGVACCATYKGVCEK